MAIKEQNTSRREQAFYEEAKQLVAKYGDLNAQHAVALVAQLMGIIAMFAVSDEFSKEQVQNLIEKNMGLAADQIMADALKGLPTRGNG